MEHLHRNNLYDVKDRVALVTGGGTGIGLMITETLVKNGAKVYIGSRRDDKVQQVARETPGHIVPAGITGPSSPFFNDESAPENKSAAPLGTALFENEKVEEWQGLYGNNVASIFFVTTAFLGLLAKGSEQRGPWSACVINISSVSGQIRISQAKWAYNSSKSANIHLTKMFATEFALKNIQSDHTLGKEDVNKAAQGLQPVPFARSGNDIDMGGITLFLSSPAGYYVHGQVITIDGGFGAVQPSSS
ncbi:short-chain dehydrogenase [Rhizoctonia solani AG-1 IB]|uniref:Short-chain dehydrogenase n=1 Tax=Thanatephorus cucumeris (strain AG1-IB / isolate 7/3/14) TaxID=1108050 RepID=M5C659_THACB|nr:short-chain dehydrogenase [Rhizoctonia solani AG-1 IB]